MNTDVKILLKKGLIFMLPVLAWITIVVIVDHLIILISRRKSLKKQN